MKAKIFKILYLIILYGFPLLNLVVFYAFVFKAIGKLGYLPTYNNPDPKSIESLELHRNLIYDLGDLMLISVAAILIGLLLSFVLKGRFFKNLRIHYLISFILILLNFIGPFNEWFAD